MLDPSLAYSVRAVAAPFEPYVYEAADFTQRDAFSYPISAEKEATSPFTVGELDMDPIIPLHLRGDARPDLAFDSAYPPMDSSPTMELE